MPKTGFQQGNMMPMRRAMANQRYGGGHGSPSQQAEASCPPDFSDLAPAIRLSPYGTKRIGSHQE